MIARSDFRRSSIAKGLSLAQAFTPGNPSRRYAFLPRRSSFILHPSSLLRRAFTLVEMLVVVVILTMLALLVVFALRGAQESAREAKTKATIQKLDNIIRTIYEAYRTRRVPVDTSAMQPFFAAQERLVAVRDLMRMEMPERLTDITSGPLGSPTGQPSPFPGYVSVPEPSLHSAYRARLSAAAGTMGPNAPAECLYLIVTLLGGEDARAQFAADEVATDPSDGLQMFIDGWGRPIYFLRWAPGFNDSDVQCNIHSATECGPAAEYDHDPFDPRKMDRNAWRLVPLIYSAGRDGEYGLWVNLAKSSYTWKNDTYAWVWDPDLNVNVLRGQPVFPGAYDNIHNHQAETP